MFRSLLATFNKCCFGSPEDTAEDEPQAHDDLTQAVPANIQVDEIIPSRAKRMREEEGDNLSVAGCVEMRNWHKDQKQKSPIMQDAAAVPEGQSIHKKLKPAEEFEMVEMQPGKVATLVTENIPMKATVAQDANAEGLPRPLFSSFWSERNINKAVEQAFLKQFLKERGLYNKHQTIEQRRRLKQLLELEQRTLLLHSEQYNARPDDDEVMSGVHSLQLTTQSNTTSRTCSIEFHAIPFPSPDPTPDTVLSSVGSRRVSSLPALAFGAMDLPPDEVTASHPTVAAATKRWERILVWKMVVQGDVPPYLETEV
uniref:Uncharacterized protein n=1 Tax=Anopheles melas TaxID=34690 RepID=A0A182UB85_9DIPT